MFGDGVPLSTALAVLRRNGITVTVGHTEEDLVTLVRDEVIVSEYFYPSVPRDQLLYLARKFILDVAQFYAPGS